MKQGPAAGIGAPPFAGFPGGAPPGFSGEEFFHYLRLCVLIRRIGPPGAFGGFPPPGFAGQGPPGFAPGSRR